MTGVDSAGKLWSDPAVLFGHMWITMSDLLGSAATATLLRRAIKRAAGRVPELAGLIITRERFNYQYALPASWERGEYSEVALRELVFELRPLLIELTGPVVMNRLRGNAELCRSRLFAEELGP